jgi:hypothetical protein
VTSGWYKTFCQQRHVSVADSIGSKTAFKLYFETSYYYQKQFYLRDDFDFGLVNYPHSDGDVAHATSFGVYVPQ